jgi:molecular chaperone DnaJ
MEGLARLKIEAGTEGGKVFRLRGKGAPSVEGYGAGDLHVKVIIEVPAGLSSRQKKALREFADQCNGDNYPLVRKLHEQAAAFLKTRDDLKRSKTES